MPPSAEARRPALAGRALACIVTVVALACALLPTAAHATRDDQAPRLLSLSVSATDPIGPDQEFFITHRAEDEAGYLGRLEVTFLTPLGGYVTVEALIGVALAQTRSHWVSRNWPDGTYRVHSVYVADPSGNGARYWADGSANVSPGGATGQTTHSLDLSGGFTVSGSTADTATPALHAVSASSQDAAAPGEDIVVDYALSDDSGRVDTLILTYQNPLGKTYQFAEQSQTGLPLVGQLRRKVSESWPNGPYTLLTVMVVDSSQNSALYRTDGTVEKNPPGASGPTTHTLALSAADFSVAGSTADTSPPQITGFTVSAPTPYAVHGDTVSVDYTATDDSGRLQSIVFSFRDRLGGWRDIRAPRGGSPLSGSVSTVVPEEWRDGTHELVQIWLTDDHGNNTLFYADGRIVKDSPGASGPTRHNLDFAAGTFQVGVAAEPDTTIPAVEHFNMSAATVDASERDVEVQLSARITDARGVAEAHVWFRHHERGHLLGPTTLHRVSGTSKDGLYEGTLIVPHGAALGEWSVWVSASDTVGNQGSPDLPDGSPTGFISVTGQASSETPPAESPEEPREPAATPEEPTTTTHAFTSRSTDAACPADQLPPNPFVDVATGSTHERAIACLVWWGVAQGRTATSYAPAADVTREAMATFVARAILAAKPGSLPDDPPDAFLDDEASVHERAVNQLAAVGIVAGTGGRTYSPHAAVTRGQMARFLANAAAHVLGQPLPADHDAFHDDQGSVFEADINRVAQAGLTGGLADGTYGASHAVRRDQMGSFLARTLDLFVTDGAQLPR
jgi:hypothetical protein